MCGIAGWVAFERDLTKEGVAIDAMTKTMSCRGPDAEGSWFDSRAGLGHRRLAVIDLPGGVQPMSVSTPNGDVAMVYSGEVYNFAELRKELIGIGERFTTSGDTEVVLRGYLRWGDGVADRLNGMYAFAIWDARERKLVMIRDRMGVKPLYFFPTSDGALFGSEPKAILANPLAKRVIDLDGLREMMSYVQTPGHAVWKGMAQVRPGTVVTVDDRGIRERTYWRLESRLHTDDQQTTVVHVRELLEDIIRRQLVADVPICVLLSGGLDSSTITALSARMLDTPIRSFAVDFEGQAKNFKPNGVWPSQDTPYVHEVARHVGSEHADIMLDHTTLADPDVRRKAVAARDVPAGVGNMDVSMYLLFRAIRAQSTVALSGESADEIFGGYREFQDPKTQRADAFPWHVDPNSLSRCDIWLPTPDLANALDLETYRADRYREAVAEVARIPEEDDSTHRMRVMSYLYLTRFVQFLLTRKDRLSMAVGLEVRVPFCDHRLVEYVYNTAWSLKNYDGREKSLLRGAARDVLPHSVVQRAKSGYPTAHDPQYGAEIQQQARHLLASGDDALFDLMDRAQLEQATEWEPAMLPAKDRRGMETALEVAAWLDVYEPTVLF